MIGLSLDLETLDRVIIAIATCHDRQTAGMSPLDRTYR